MKNALLLIFACCCFTFARAQQYSIIAHVTGFPDGTKFYLNDVDIDTDIDSALIRNNSFSLKGTLGESPRSLWVSTVFNNKTYYFSLLMGNEKVSVKGDIKDFPFDLKITGSKTQDGHNKLISLIKEGYKQRNPLVEEYFALKGDSARAKAVQTIIAKLDSVDKATRMNYVRQNLNSYSGLNALFDLKDDFPADTMRLFYKSINPEFRNSRFGKRIDTYIKVGKILEEGDAFYDFAALDKEGNKHQLSDIKGKYILLDFSATYCGPCIASLPELTEVSRKYANQLTVITFSGDGGKETWLRGLNRDQPQWLSLWDGKGSYGETAIKYGVSGYPSFVLINPERKIVSKWIGYDKGIVLKKIESFLNLKSR
ncbi:MAG: TlpA disulfide reductase family protein [Pedobacter sp.]